jgi:penicillin-binding protein 1B
MISLLLEYRYDKRAILETWSNNCTFISETGVVAPGVLSASHNYFGKDLAELDEADVKLLAAGIQPFYTPSPDETVTSVSPRAARSRVPWLVADLQKQLEQRFPKESLHRDGLELRTTIHPILQEAATRSIREGLEELRAEHPTWWQGETGPEAALIAMDPRNGAIRAMASSVKWKIGASNPALERLATAGSAFKPIVLAAAIAADWPKLGPLSEVLDEPIAISGSELLSTNNEDGTFLGRVSLRTATERSRKPPFVRLGMNVGPKRLLETARSLGIESVLRPRLSLALGEQQLTLMDLCTAYATIANAGTRPHPRLLDGLRRAQGNWLERAMPDSRGAIDPRVASVVTTLLQGVVERGTAHQVRDLGFHLPLAGNPGLSHNRRDAWMIGFTPDLVVGLWIGGNMANGLRGASEDVAVSSWTRFLLEVEPFLEGGEFRQPPGSELAGNPSREQGTSSPLQKKLRDEDRARRREERKALQLMDQGTL